MHAKYDCKMFLPDSSKITFSLHKARLKVFLGRVFSLPNSNDLFFVKFAKVFSTNWMMIKNPILSILAM